MSRADDEDHSVTIEVDKDILVLPYAMSDKATAVVSIQLDELLEKLLEGGSSVRASASAAATAAAAT